MYQRRVRIEGEIRRLKLYLKEKYISEDGYVKYPCCEINWAITSLEKVIKDIKRDEKRQKARLEIMSLMDDLFKDAIPYTLVMQHGTLLKEVENTEFKGQIWEYEGKQYRLVWDKSNGSNVVYKKIMDE